MKIESTSSEFEVVITAKVDRKVVTTTTITVMNLAHLGRMFETIGDATSKVAADIEAEEIVQESSE